MTKKIIISILVISIALVAVMVIAQDKTGEKSQEKKTKPAIKDSELITDDYARALEAKATELAKREKDIVRKELELSFLEQDIVARIKAFEKDKEAFEEEKKKYQDKIDREEKEKASERVRLLATRIKNIKANVAAEQMIELYKENKSTALYVLALIDNRAFGKIFSKISNARLAAQIMDDLKNWRVSDEGQDLLSIQE